MGIKKYLKFFAVFLAAVICMFSFENVKSVIEQYLIGSVIFAVGCSILAGTIAFILLTACRKKKI